VSEGVFGVASASCSRECRGVIFHGETGQLLARRLHKFFNINEMDECTEDKIDLSRSHYILEKADGYAFSLNILLILRCLVSPFISMGRLRWGSKGGITDLSTFIEKTFLPKRPNMDYTSLRYV
jgi:hypothetical protein